MTGKWQEVQGDQLQFPEKREVGLIGPLVFDHCPPPEQHFNATIIQMWRPSITMKVVWRLSGEIN